MMEAIAHNNNDNNEWQQYRHAWPVWFGQIAAGKISFFSRVESCSYGPETTKVIKNPHENLFLRIEQVFCPFRPK